MNKINISFDMETSDPDDVFTLCMLSHHPQVNLVSVTVTPGTKHQIGLVKFILNKLGKFVPVGSRNKNHDKQCVSAFHYNWLGSIPPEEPDDTSVNILINALRNYPDLRIVCGAPLGNIGLLLDNDVLISKIIVQGGFAGDNIMPSELILNKFKGKLTCPTFNLNGDVSSSLKLLSCNKIQEKIFVSKNICHGVIYDQKMHKDMIPYLGSNKGLDLLIHGMDYYLSNKPSGKAFHDPLAACVAINKDVCQFKKVELYREKGEWGSRYSNHPNAEISIQVDMDKFKTTMVGQY